MKNNRRKYFGFALAGFATLVIGSLFVFAQGEHGRHHRGGFEGGFPPQFMIDKIANELGLSEEQKSQAKTIIDDAKKRIEPLFAEMKQNHESAMNLGTDGNFDEAKVTEISNRQSETMKQLFIEKEKTKAQLFAILTPEQSEKARQLHAKFGEHMKNRFGRGDKSR